MKSAIKGNERKLNLSNKKKAKRQKKKNVQTLAILVGKVMNNIPISHNYLAPEVIKLLSCSTQLSPKFQLLLKTAIPTNKEVSCFKSLR